MTREDDDREKRQFRLMEERVLRFQSGDLNLGQTIADLKGLLAALERTPEAWKAQFGQEWGELEVGYAVALNNEAPIPTASDPVVEQATHKMIQLVRDRLEQQT
jgi:hypothetical protein